MKIQASTRLDEKLLRRAEKIADADHRTIANVIEICVMNHLPVLEKEVMGETSEKKGKLTTASA